MNATSLGLPAYSSQAQRKVAVFCTTFLPYSQTFIWDELRSHERYLAQVFAWRRANERLYPGEIHVARPWYPLTRRDTRFDCALAAGRYALIHAHFGWAGAIAVSFARRHGLPLVVTFHGLDVAMLATGHAGSPLAWPYTLRARELRESMTLGLCASADLLELLVKRGFRRERMREHRLGIDVERFHAGRRDPSPFRVAMVGRLVEKKGFADGLRSFARLVARQPQATLEVAGSGPLEGELRGLVTRLGLSGHVNFLGALAHADVAKLLARSHVLLAPSHVAPDGDRDSGLLSAKEASASGCVPIATRHGGIPAIIEDGKTGFLVAERDVEALASRLWQLAADPQLRIDMAAAAREKMVREYSLGETVRRLEEFYDEAICRHTKVAALKSSGGTVAAADTSP